MFVDLDHKKKDERLRIFVIFRFFRLISKYVPPGNELACACLTASLCAFYCTPTLQAPYGFSQPAGVTTQVPTPGLEDPFIIFMGMVVYY